LVLARFVSPTVTYFLAGYFWTLMAQAPYLLAAEDWSAIPPFIFVSRNVVLSGGIPLLFGVISGIVMCKHVREVKKGYRAVLAAFSLLFAFAPVRHRWIWGDDVLTTLSDDAPLFSRLMLAFINWLGDLAVAILPLLMVGLACKLSLGRFRWTLIWAGAVLLVIADRLTMKAIQMAIGNDWFPPILAKPLVFATWVGVLAGFSGFWTAWCAGTRAADTGSN
jgi:hypothetical protein